MLWQWSACHWSVSSPEVYNFTDLPSILSDDMVPVWILAFAFSGSNEEQVMLCSEVLFLDPHVHHLSAMGASAETSEA